MRRQRLSRAQLGRLHRPQRRQDRRGLPRGLRARCRHHARHQLPFPTEGFRRIAEAVGPAKLTWLELDTHDPKSIALIRRDAPCPIASGETLLERRDFRPYFEAYAFDTAIVDVIWNGFTKSLKIAAMADVYEVNVAPHNFYGHLASAISAHFCAAVPNFRIMEIDIDGVPWRDEIVERRR